MSLLLPKDGSIVIIDDQYNDAKPLIDILTKKGHPSIYFTGTIDNLPETSLERVRIVFADIQLTPALNEQQYAAIIIDHLNLLISDNNGPYILLVWSGKGDLYFQRLKEMVDAPAFVKKPIAFIEINKSDYFKTTSRKIYEIENLKEDLETRFSKEDIEYVISKIDENIPVEEDKICNASALKKISTRIRKELKNYQGFELLIKWEALVHRAATKLTSGFASIHAANQYWDFNFKNIVSRLAQAQVGASLKNLDRKSFIKASIKTLNAAFSDYLDGEVLSIISLTPSEEASYKSSGYAVMIEGVEYKIVWKDYERFEFLIDTVKTGGDHKKIETLKGIGGNNQALKQVIADMTTSYTLINPELNTKLNVDLHTRFPFQPGIVYEIDVETEVKRNFLQTYFTANFLDKNQDGFYKITDDEVNRYRFVELEVSPNCDFANNKWLKHRTISGILYPGALDKNLKGDDSIYDEFPLLSINGEVTRLIICFKLLKSFDLSKGKRRSRKFLFKIKEQPMADILTRLASHASRIGIIEFK
ncbi:MAG: hypothetical protein JNK27_04875 [Chitinophagaceae bacterium]|nr:hypothetical protein [Chitinophagaceae bacterium]